MPRAILTVALALVLVTAVKAQADERWLIEAGPGYSPTKYQGDDDGAPAVVASVVMPIRDHEFLSVGLQRLKYESDVTATFTGLSVGPRYFIAKRGAKYGGIFIEILPAIYNGTWRDSVGFTRRHILPGFQEGGGFEVGIGRLAVGAAIHWVLTPDYKHHNVDGNTLYEGLDHAVVSLRVGILTGSD